MCYFFLLQISHNEVHRRIATEKKKQKTIPLENVLDEGRTNRLFTERRTGLSAEQRRGDVVPGSRRDVSLQRAEVTQEEPLENVPVHLRQPRDVPALRRVGQLALDVPEGLEHVEHVPAVLVEELPHKGGARPRGGHEQDVLVRVAGVVVSHGLLSRVLVLSEGILGRVVFVHGAG